MARYACIQHCLLKGLTAFNRRSADDCREMAEVWEGAFSQLTDLEFKKAYDHALATCPRLPIIVDVLNAHDVIRPRQATVIVTEDWSKKAAEKGRLWVQLRTASSNGEYQKKLVIIQQLREAGAKESVIRPIELQTIGILEGDKKKAISATRGARLPEPLAKHAIEAVEKMFPEEGQLAIEQGLPKKE